MRGGREQAEGAGLLDGLVAVVCTELGASSARTFRSLGLPLRWVMAACLGQCCRPAHPFIYELVPGSRVPTEHKQCAYAR